jgi:hydroxymethylglutaryl-CoA lyase
MSTIRRVTNALNRAVVSKKSELGFAIGVQSNRPIHNDAKFVGAIKRLPPSVELIEVGPRDGLQNLPFLETAHKLFLIGKLAEAGIRNIEVTSFASPKVIPQFADNVEVLKKTQEKFPEVNSSVLVMNPKQVLQAHDAGAKELGIFMPASTLFAQKNVKVESVDAMLFQVAEMLELARSKAIEKLRVYLSAAFHSPFAEEGRTDPRLAVRLTKQLFGLGASRVALSGTTGHEVTADIHGVLSKLEPEIAAGKIELHLHDTYGQAMANTVKGRQMGVNIIHTSIGGLGGCPFAPGASGNFATEDVVYFLEKSGVNTGVEMRCLIEASRYLEEVCGLKITSKVYHALKNEKNLLRYEAEVEQIRAAVIRQESALQR